MTPEQAEILVKLKEIEVQTRCLLAELNDAPSLSRTRIQHIQGLCGYLRTMVGTQLTLVRKPSTEAT
jgi:hypothetical protein